MHDEVLDICHEHVIVINQYIYEKTISLIIIREMQIKIAMREYFKPVSLAKN